jgi:hypothetical protein
MGGCCGLNRVLVITKGSGMSVRWTSILCKRCGEFVDHLFPDCEIASALWSAIFRSAGFTWVMPRRVVDLFTCWRRLSGNPHSATV